MTFPSLARGFHLCQILDVYVCTWWCKVVDIIRFVVNKCCEWIKACDSVRSAHVARQNLLIFVTRGLIFTSAAVK